ncbi:MAG TPA: hypothetical protein VI039_13135 [Solirubrobacterales bacterium]
MAREEPISIQRYSLGLDTAGKPRLVYDMHGEVVRFSDHEKAVNTERALADARVEDAAKAAAEPCEPTQSADFHPARKQLFEAVKALRALGWSDGDIIFGAELEPDQPTTLIAPTDQQEGEDRG